MNRLLNLFRSPVALGGLVAAGIVFAVAGAGIVTGGFSMAQEEPTATSTRTASDDTATPDSSEDVATATADTPSDGDATPSQEKESLGDDFLNRLADELGISRDELDQAMRNVGLAMIDQAVADGRITEDEAARIRDAIENGKIPPLFVGPRFHHGYGGFFLGASIEDIADFLGVDRQVVIDGLHNDQSLAQIAEANGSSRDALKEHLMTQLTGRVNQAVQDGKINQDRANEILSNAPERIDEFIDRQGFPEPKINGRGPWHDDDDGDDVAPQDLPAPDDSGFFGGDF